MLVSRIGLVCGKTVFRTGRDRQSGTHDLRRSCARLCHGCGGELEKMQFLLGPLPCKPLNAILDASTSLKKQSMIDLESQSQAMPLEKFGKIVRNVGNGVLYHSLWLVSFVFVNLRGSTAGDFR